MPIFKKVGRGCDEGVWNFVPSQSKGPHRSNKFILGGGNPTRQPLPKVGVE